MASQKPDDVLLFNVSQPCLPSTARPSSPQMWIPWYGYRRIALLADTDAPPPVTFPKKRSSLHIAFLNFLDRFAPKPPSDHEQRIESPLFAMRCLRDDIEVASIEAEELVKQTMDVHAATLNVEIGEEPMESKARKRLEDILGHYWDLHNEADFLSKRVHNANAELIWFKEELQTGEEAENLKQGITDIENKMEDLKSDTQHMKALIRNLKVLVNAPKRQEHARPQRKRPYITLLDMPQGSVNMSRPHAGDLDEDMYSTVWMGTD